ncbi:phage holin family protein [Rhizobium sp. Rhizsp82]|uniref:phage holin family protein n=1 Tax=Rhizobium sp. Rhizsp82 TaxID=3243057 RepID=UPI0039B4E929
MAEQNQNAPLSELISGLIADVSGLMRKEIDLAKTEASERIASALGGIEVIVVGLVLSIGAVGVLLSALVSGLALLFVRNGMGDAESNALAALIVGAVIGVVAWVLVSRGIAALRSSNLKLDRTTTSLRRDVGIVKEKI